MKTGKRVACIKRVAIYARVSTDKQTTENQTRQLRRIAKAHGWEVVEEFIDKGISGAKGREQRPAFDRLLKGVSRRAFDLIAVWSVDRLGRNLGGLVGFLGELKAKGVNLYLHQEGIDTQTPSGEALFQMCGVFAQFERALILERVNAGLARARAQGKTLGRPRVSAAVEARVRALRDTGMGMIRIAKEAGTGVGTVQRIIRNSTA